MTFYADLHIHSRFSRATSRDCNLEQLAYWARSKGIAVIGTGDFTHPAWFNEIREKLVPAEPGLFRLRPDLEREIKQRQVPSCESEAYPAPDVRGGASALADGGTRRSQGSSSAIESKGLSSVAVGPRGKPRGILAKWGETRFMLEVEISTIYKKHDRTRKVHHVIYVPGLEEAERVIQRLSRIGNLKSDGRPILGLDSRDLLEITLESGDGSYLVPAHIWTPWFSVLGSKSGFDTIDECYGDLASHIFAVETGLSSDPPMNWRFSSLDRYRLVSNSDAHSPAKLGREACVFDTETDYFAMRRALETGHGYGGTVEFFPEEGKYHLDGHRKCGIRFSPEETRKNGGLCPVCGRAVTVGVMHRVDELADRPKGSRPRDAAPFRSFVPLAEVLSQILGVGANTKNVRTAYQALISRLGTELFILEHAAIEDIRRLGSPILAEAIARMRDGRVIREAGFDGEYGVIRLFGEDELRGQEKGEMLFDVPPVRVQRPTLVRHSPQGDGGSNVQVKERRAAYSARACPPKPWRRREPLGILDSLDPDQRAAAEITEGPLLITAGPGTGKTRTLTHRIAHMVADHGVPPEQCLAITFTKRAAAEMAERLQRLLPDKAARIPVMTFHALGYSMLREHGDRLELSASGGFRVAGDLERTRILMQALSIPERKAKRLLAEISKLKRTKDKPTAGGDMAHALDAYRRQMRTRSLADFDDLIGLPVELLDSHPDLVAHYRERYPWVSIDEYQDIDQCQYRLIKLLVPPDGHVCAIGDPDQAIYGFRGTDVRFFKQFSEDFLNARTVQLTRNYRSGKMIVEASMQVIARSSLVEERALDALAKDTTRIVIHESATDRAEAEFVVHTVERLIGGSTFFSMDSGRVEAGDGEATSTGSASSPQASSLADTSRRLGQAGQALSFSDFGVLYRTDAQAEALCEAFARSGMPFQKRSHVCLADSPLVQSLIGVMRDTPSSVRHDGLRRGTPEECALAERLNQAIAGLDEQERQGDALLVTHALQTLAEHCHDLEGFLSELAMGVDVDLWDPRAECVSLLTLHASKGLEFPVVFMVGCEDGILPLRWGTSRDGDVDEERRLFFVGMTRARDRLFLCHARKRLWMRKHRQMETSPFLRDIEEKLLERTRTQARRKRSARTDEQLNLFQ